MVRHLVAYRQAGRQGGVRRQRGGAAAAAEAGMHWTFFVVSSTRSCRSSARCKWQRAMQRLDAARIDRNVAKHSVDIAQSSGQGRGREREADSLTRFELR